MDLNSIEYAGRVARAEGKSQSENPYFTPQYLPKNTGETQAGWQAKIEAWENGWRRAGNSNQGHLASALA